VTAGGRRKQTGTRVGRVRCRDGVERDVYQDADGRQYVVGDQGEKVFGLWMPDAPSAAPREGSDAKGDAAGPAAPADGADAPPEATPWERPGAVRRDCESHRGRLLALLGTISFGCGVVGVLFAPAGVVGLLLGLWVRGAARRDLGQMDDGSMDADGAGQTRDARTDATLGAVLGGVGLLLGTGLVLAVLFLFF
jgi:hypothetical protein